MLGMPVYKLQSEMPFEELKKWMEYFKVRPYGWRDDNRTYSMMRAFGVKEKPEAIFPSIAAIKNYKPSGINLKGTKLLSMMLKAKGGEALEL